ncbi:unnamed protein product [Paramecium octaurelia]|uniref:Uncharacterized protein n=1 Tax=Paramecium octaurelia TaxID=43137 RepID=A0A8S1W1E6_PAROT|nr:unnamed protein product [Paramecium octaurelia]
MIKKLKLGLINKMKFINQNSNIRQIVNILDEEVIKYREKVSNFFQKKILYNNALYLQVIKIGQNQQIKHSLGPLRQMYQFHLPGEMDFCGSI